MEKEIKKIILQALIEDKSQQDITTKILLPQNQISKATILVREPSVICGLKIVKFIFRQLDPKMKFTVHHSESSFVKKNSKIISLEGKTRALLSGERVALNFLAYTSGIATQTYKFVHKVKPYNVKIMDTRKTIPGLRALVKMAVRAGGGVNHRFNLNEMVMIKDNHLIAYKRNGNLANAVHQVRMKTYHLIVVEVDDLIQFRQALDSRPDIILLDNMRPHQIRKAVKLNKMDQNPSLLEASGGITLRNIREFAKTGVDRISIGALTHSPQAIDFSMEFKEPMEGKR